MPSNGYTAELTLSNEHGLHLRPSSKFVSLANRFRAQVFVSVDGGEEGNGKSILDLTARAAAKGALFRIRTVGEEAKETLDALVELVKRGFQDASPEEE